MFRWRVIVSTFFLILLAILLLGGMSVIEKEDVLDFTDWVTDLGDDLKDR